MRVLSEREIKNLAKLCAFGGSVVWGACAAMCAIYAAYAGNAADAAISSGIGLVGGVSVYGGGAGVIGAAADRYNHFAKKRNSQFRAAPSGEHHGGRLSQIGRTI